MWIGFRQLSLVFLDPLYSKVCGKGLVQTTYICVWKWFQKPKYRHHLSVFFFGLGHAKNNKGFQCKFGTVVPACPKRSWGQGHSQRCWAWGVTFAPVARVLTGKICRLVLQFIHGKYTVFKCWCFLPVKGLSCAWQYPLLMLELVAILRWF